MNSMALSAARDMAKQAFLYVHTNRIADAMHVLQSLISYLDELYVEQARIEKIHAETSRAIQRALELSKKTQR